MTRKGLTLPNYQWRAWSAEEMAAVVALRPEVLVVLLYAREIPASQEKWAQLQDLLIACPSVRTLQLRPYSDRIHRITAYGWAAECWTRIVPYLRMRPDVEVELIPANEINLEWGHSDWDAQAAWLIAFAEAWGAWDVGQQVALHLPALSPGVEGYEAGWQRFAALEVCGAYDVIDIHCYEGASERDYVRVHAYFPDFAVSITEFNQVDPAAYLASLPGYVRDASWFILAGEEDQRPYWLMGSPAYDSYKRHTHREEAVTMTLVDQHPEEYAVWKAEGGIENNFRTHLLALGVIEAGPDDLRLLAREAVASAEQLRLTLARYPF